MAGRKGKNIDWSPYMHRLGNEDDGTIAREIGCSLAAVHSARKRFGIPRYIIDHTKEPCGECGTIGRYKKHSTLCKKCYADRRLLLMYPELNKGMIENATNCEICGDSFEVAYKCADHDHDTGKFRGFLCRECNRGLGAFKDDPKRIKGAIKFLGRKIN